MSIISTENVSVIYSEAKTVKLPDISIGRGEKVFIRGRSGSGKTTLLSLLAAVFTPDKGSIRVLENDYIRMKSHARDRFRGDHIGYIFQQFNLIPYLSVRENIILGAQMSALRLERIGRPLHDEAVAFAERLNIADVLEHAATDISVGQAQRAACARALIGSPEIILADEPTSALDTDNRETFIDLVLETAGESSTVLFVSHDGALSNHFERVIEL